MLRIFGCLKNYVDHIGKSREKKLELNHCEKVGAVNALVRASIVLTDAPHMLNLERDNHINNCKALKEIVLYNGLEKDRWFSSFGPKDQIRIACFRTCSSC